MSNILVVEDDINVRENILTLLNKSGYKADGAGNGLEAMSQYSKNEYNLIISDVMMPYMNGFELFSKIRENANEEMIPFIFLSAKTDTESIRHGMNLGSDDYITKPFRKKDLFNAIEIRMKKNELISKTKVAENLKSEFLAQISHEIRTPISSIINLTSLIKSECSKDDKKDCDLIIERIEKSGHRIIRTIDLLVYMSQLKSNTYNIRKARLNIEKDIIIPLLDEKHFGTAIAKNIKINLINDAIDNDAEVDTESLTQIIDNLIDNAVKFTVKGIVNIKLSNKLNETIIIEIEDTGVGIKEDFLLKAFDPFSQEESGYTRSYEGCGLGLAIAKQFCDQNNYELEIESIKNKGTIVKLIIPITNKV